MIPTFVVFSKLRQRLTFENYSFNRHNNLFHYLEAR